MPQTSFTCTGPILRFSSPRQKRWHGDNSRRRQSMPISSVAWNLWAGASSPNRSDRVSTSSSSAFTADGMANVDVINPTWDMINEKEGAIVYGRTKFPKLAKPLLIDRFAEIIDKYRGTGIDNYVFPVYTRKHQ